MRANIAIYSNSELRYWMMSCIILPAEQSQFKLLIKHPHLDQTENKTSCRRTAATVCPAPLLPPWPPTRLAPQSSRQCSSSFPRPTRSHTHLCSRLTRQHGGEQSSLVTLTFNQKSGVRITCDVSYLLPILVFLGLSVLDLG